MSTETPHLPIGTVLAGGKYRIVRFIGAGGFGCTYEAEFVPMKSRVAIKEFFVGACCNRDATGTVSIGIVSQSALVDKLEEKFRAEAQRIFSLKHPGIVTVTDIFAENGTSYYTMDFISGRSLQSTIEHNGPLPEAQALRYIGQVMDALEYVHSKNMLHLDIKPDNIMIDEHTDSAILIDFGVSKQYDEVDGHNNSTITGQTPGYAPPEQVGNSIRQFTPAADIYSLGATLYTAITACVPPSSPDIISGVAHLSPLPDGTSASTHRAISMMMQPNVNKRPQSIAAVRALLNGHVQPAKPVHINNLGIRPSSTSSVHDAPAPLPAKPARKRLAKKWLWTIVLGGIIVTGLLITCLVWLFENRSNHIYANDYYEADSLDYDYYYEEVVEAEEVPATEEDYYYGIAEPTEVAAEAVEVDELVGYPVNDSIWQ